MIWAGARLLSDLLAAEQVAVSSASCAVTVTPDNVITCYSEKSPQGCWGHCLGVGELETWL